MSRPTAYVNLRLQGGIGKLFPADILAVFDLDTSISGDKSRIATFAYLQVYDFVYLADAPGAAACVHNKHTHAMVPGCDFMHLCDSFELLPVSSILRPAHLVPVFTQKGPRDKRRFGLSGERTERISAETKEVRPLFHVVEAPL